MVYLMALFGKGSLQSNEVYTNDRYRFQGNWGKAESSIQAFDPPLAVYGSEILPASIPPMTKVNRCFAVSMYCGWPQETRYQRPMSVQTPVKDAASVGSTMWNIVQYQMKSSILYRPAEKIFAAG